MIIEACAVPVHHWWQWHPPVGVAVLFLGAAAMAMPLFKEHWGRVGKIGWAALITILVGLEFWSIHWTEDWNTEEKNHSWCLQEQKFLDISGKAGQAADRAGSASQKASEGVDRMVQLIGSAKQINATTKETLDQQTGNHQFCMLNSGMPVGLTHDGKAVYKWMVLVNGPLPLDYCYVHISDASPITSAEDAERRFLQSVWDGQLGPLAPGKVRGKPGATEGQLTRILLPEGSYNIQITTRNDRFNETLSFGRNPKPFETIEIKDDWGKVVYKSPNK